jgi:ABC-2 type transport system ATP-binding protein
MEHAPILSIRGVEKAFGNIQALKGVSIDIPQQSIFGLLGPNGAGKTTLFSVIANFLKADAGEIDVLGTDVKQISKLQGRMTILPQDALFQRNVPIRDQLAFFRQLDGQNLSDAREEVERTLDRVGLDKYKNRRVHALSHGMIKRLGLAQAFLGEPELILLDEPTSGLDPQNARQIRDLIREMHTRATIVISSHNLAEIQELCDHVAILDEGEVVTVGSVEEITRAGRSVNLGLSRELVEEETRRLTSIPGVAALECKQPLKYTAAIDLSDPNLTADEVTNGLLRTLLELEITPRSVSEGSSLEDVFLKVTGGGED